ncbi:MAG: hypothetical protein HQL90_09945 [Magnetococcales bacterium]|nr:hypothetical protein [Magnetococcales bacterium]
MHLVVGTEHAPLSADALQRQWLENLGHMENMRYQEVVQQLLAVLSVDPPDAFYDLLGVRSHQFFKKRKLSQFYPSLQLFVWRKALEQTQPLYAPHLFWLWRRTFLAQQTTAKPRLQRMENHLALFALLTDNFAEAGFMSVAHHVVLRVLGALPDKADHLVAVVQLADHLEMQFNRYVTAFERAAILP